MDIDFSILPASDQDAAARAARYASEDPFPSIPCSLLGSAEVIDYVRLTGMLHPFSADGLKSASYEVHAGGSFIYWDENGHKFVRTVSRGSECELPANSITFMQVEPKFRLPNYIAIRFNLRITHVHRGLLLGTGPLVDPGFEGKLLIPLHNLTATPYVLNTDEALIWIEFTKTTFGRWPIEARASNPRRFVPFPEDKKNKSPDYYLWKANLGNPIRGSIPDVIAQGRRDVAVSAASATRAARAATLTRNWVAGIGVVALVGLGVGLGTLFLQVDTIVQTSNALAVDVDKELASASHEAKSAKERSEALKGEVKLSRTRLIGLRGSSTSCDMILISCAVVADTVQPPRSSFNTRSSWSRLA